MAQRNSNFGPSAIIKTPEATLSFPHLFEMAETMKGNGKLRYQARFIFDEAADLSAIKGLAVQQAVDFFGLTAEEVAAEAKAGTLHWPFTPVAKSSGGQALVERFGEEAVSIGAKSKNKPPVVAAYADPNTGRPFRIEDPTAVYPGLVVIGLVECYCYQGSGRGITFGLSGVQILRDGEPLGRAPVNVDDQFEVDENARPADMLPGVVEDRTVPAPTTIDPTAATDPLDALGL